MWKYTLRRILATLPTLLTVITVCYLMLHMTPGGPFDSERKIPTLIDGQPNILDHAPR